MLKTRWQDWVELALGAWLLVSPWVLGFQGTEIAMWNAVILGGVIAVYAMFELGIPKAWEEWISMLLGAWLVVSPFALKFSAQHFASWDTIIVGVLTAVFAAWGLALGTQIQKHSHEGTMGH